ncbi:MAG: hypothetical protein RJA36_3642 [Pseudomonadota bacterium]|jgi:hypothetical protein
MSPEQIRSAIQADAGLLALAQAAASDADIAALAASVAQQAPKRVVLGSSITTRGAAARFPSIGGLPPSLSFEAAMMALETFATAGAQSSDMPTKLLARAVSRQIEGFQRLGLDFGEPELRTMLDYLTTLQPAVLTTAQAAGFKALADAAEVVTPHDIKAAIYADDGTLLV